MFLFENKSIVRRCLAHLYNYSLYVACSNGVSRGSILSLMVTPGVHGHEIIQKCVHHEWNRSIVSDILTMRVIVELKSNRSTILVYFPFKPPPFPYKADAGGSITLRSTDESLWKEGFKNTCHYTLPNTIQCSRSRATGPIR